MNKFPVYKLLQRTTLVLTVLLMAGPAQQPALAMPKLEDEIPSLTLTKVADSETISPGQTITFTITIINEGNEKAENISLEDDYNQDILPTIAEIQSSIINNTLPSDSDAEVDETDGDIFPAQNDGEKITWDIGTIAQGEEIQLSYQATATEVFKGDDIIMVNTATIFVNDTPLQQAVVELALQIPKLTLTRELERIDGEGDISPGDQITFTLHFVNEGSLAATNVIIKETFDEAVVQQIDEVTDGGLPEEGSLLWELGTLEIGRSGTVSYRMTLNPALVSVSTEENETEQSYITFTNQATIRADNAMPLSVEEEFTMTPPILSIKRDRVDLIGGSIEPGDSIIFEIQIENSSTIVSANNITITETFDRNVIAEISEISSDGVELAEEDAIEWSNIKLEPGGKKTVSYKANIKGGIEISTEAHFQASLSIMEVPVKDATAETSITIQPPKQSSDENIITDVAPKDAFVFVGSITAFAMLVVAGTALIATRKNKNEEPSENPVQRVNRGVAMIIVIQAVLILSMVTGGIGEQGTVSILSAIVGYMLGSKNGD
jgi:uncharacterized repeat protein (TIGR01451 family)